MGLILIVSGVIFAYMVTSAVTIAKAQGPKWLKVLGITVIFALFLAIAIEATA